MSKSNNQSPQQLVAACTAEIRAHVCIFIVVVLPIVSLIIPALVCAFAVYFWTRFGADLGGHGSSLLRAASENFAWLWAGALLAIVSIVGISARRELRRSKSKDPAATRSTKPPRGAKGQALITLVGQLWTRLGVPELPAPHVVWFPNFNLLAHASDVNGVQEIQVSSGLWEKAVRGDPVAEIILAHEIAHLVHRDARIFRALIALSNAARAALRISLWIVMLTGVWLVLRNFVVESSDLGPAWDVILRSVAIAVMSAFVLMIIPIGSAIVKRYGGFIISLMEIRADVSAALWIGGLERFTSALVNNPDLRRSSLSEMVRSLFSLSMTHVSDADRLAMLSDTDRLVTPKMRYFALSIALPILLPVNPVTPLIASGAIDHALVTSAVVTLHAVTVAMVLLSAEVAVLSWQRALTVGTVLCFVQALPQINLYEIGYTLTHEIVSLGNSRGFGQEPLSLARVGDDLRISLGGLAKDVLVALQFEWFLVSSVIGCVSLRLLAMMKSRYVAEFARSKFWDGMVIATVFLVSLSSSYDPWRGYLVRLLDVPIVTDWLEWLHSLPPARLCASAVSAVAVVWLMSLSTLIKSRAITWRMS